MNNNYHKGYKEVHDLLSLVSSNTVSGCLLKYSIQSYNNTGDQQGDPILQPSSALLMYK